MGALKRSNVKIEGKDVVATWKVCVALVALPLLHIIYCTLLWIFLPERWGTAFFFFSPLVCFLALQVGENLLRLWRSLIPLCYMVFHPRKTKELVKLREECVRKTQYAVDTLGWGIRLNSEVFNAENENDLNGKEKIITTGSPN